VVGSIFLGVVGILWWVIFWESSDKWDVSREDDLPFVYSDNYDISLLGLQTLHPFDSNKYSKIASSLIQDLKIEKERFIAPKKITDTQLLSVHTQAYIHSLNTSSVVAKIAEVSMLSLIPNFILQERLLDPARYGTAGTILGANLALQYGWAINLSGGYHHTKADSSSGFGYYADVPLAVETLWEKFSDMKVLIIDLDAHQGNGNESIFQDDPRVFILDIYRSDNYPSDHAVKQYIDFDYPVEKVTEQEYLSIVKEAIPQAIESVQPDIIMYNAGTDIYEKDPLGKMHITREGIIQRDAFVFGQSRENAIPILMVLSGGYTPESAEIIGASIKNIITHVLQIEI